ncbi:MAG: hypothetical protein ACRDTD_21265, partial [Pseudonocardiaceae bacterium]
LWGVHAPASVPACPGCLTGQAMHPSFAYEIAFHLVAFAALYWLKPRLTGPGELFTLYWRRPRDRAPGMDGPARR